jgi:hypothetical protein
MTGDSNKNGAHLIKPIYNAADGNGGDLIYLCMKSFASF